MEGRHLESCVNLQGPPCKARYKLSKNVLSFSTTIKQNEFRSTSDISSEGSEWWFLLRVFNYCYLTDKGRWSTYTECNTGESSEANWCCSTRYCKLTERFVSLISSFLFLVIKSYENSLIKQLILLLQVLFNDTIFHNIHYGCLSATTEEVCIQIIMS